MTHQPRSGRAVRADRRLLRRGHRDERVYAEVDYFLRVEVAASDVHERFLAEKMSNARVHRMVPLTMKTNKSTMTHQSGDDLLRRPEEDH